MSTNNTVSEEIVIVGSRHGKLADQIESLYKQESPIEVKDIRKAVGDDIVYLSPVSGSVDKLAVGVYTKEFQRLGFVWMCQSHRIHAWMKDNNQEFLGVRVKEVSTIAKVLFAEPLEPIKLPRVKRCNMDIDYSWACNLPAKLNIEKNSLHMDIFLLKKALDKETVWSEHLKQLIDKLLVSLSLELSAYTNEICMELYLQMRSSEIKEVREQAEYLLYSLVHRGSNEHINWWLESWLPDVFMTTAESDLLKMFEVARFSFTHVEDMLHAAPGHLFHLYEVDRSKFAFTLYYASLPEDQYNRLMTLLAVRELMLEKRERKLRAQRANSLTELSEKRKAIIFELDALIEKGVWAKPITAEIIKAFVRQVLGIGEYGLTDEEFKLSMKLWSLFESRKGGNAIRVTWQNLIGYLDEMGLIDNRGGSPSLNRLFFNNDEGYSNIDKGRPDKKNIRKGLKEILPLLDAYCPRKR